ncbi:MAG: hypothetical protein ACK4NC_03120 [Candidatus Gracilibacteria bacterium]
MKKEKSTGKYQKPITGLMILAYIFFAKELLPTINEGFDFVANMTKTFGVDNSKQVVFEPDTYIQEELFANFKPGMNSQLLTEKFGYPKLINNINDSKRYLQWETKKYSMGTIIEKDTGKIEMLAIYSPECRGTVKLPNTDIQGVLCQTTYPIKELSDVTMLILGGMKYGGYFEAYASGAWNSFQREYVGTSSTGTAPYVETSKSANPILNFIYDNDLVHLNPESLHFSEYIKNPSFVKARTESKYNFYATSNYSTELSDLETVYTTMERPYTY